MGPKSGHIIRHRGIIRAAQSRRWINAISALILAGTMTAPAYAGDILRGGASRNQAQRHGKERKMAPRYLGHFRSHATCCHLSPRSR